MKKWRICSGAIEIQTCRQTKRNIYIQIYFVYFFLQSHANDTHYPLDGKCVTDTSVPLKNVLSNSIDKLERCNDEFLKNELGLNENTIEMNSPVDSSLEDCIKDTDDYHIMKMFELRDAARNCINNGQ